MVLTARPTVALAHRYEAPVFLGIRAIVPDRKDSHVP
jgi:hypothetical protein